MRSYWKEQLFLAYPSLSVFCEPLAKHFEWSPMQWDQGFSWEPSAVSFRTNYHRDLVTVEIIVEAAYIISESAIRVIKVPFHNISERGAIVTSLPTETKIAIPLAIGWYALYFSISPDPTYGQIQPPDEQWDEAWKHAQHLEEWKYALSFVPAIGEVEAEIIRQDAELRPPLQLKTR